MNSKRSTGVSRLTLLVMAGLLGIGMLVFAGSTGATTAPAVYNDPQGDAASAPDISKVTIGGAGTGVFDVRIDLATMPNLAPDVLMGLYIDSDRNASTGNNVGAEFLVLTNSQGALYLKWDGSDMNTFPHSPLNPRLTGSGVSFTLNKADLGVETFNFGVITIKGDDADVSPDSGAPTLAFPHQIKRYLLPASTLIPKAGKVYRVSGVTVELDSGENVVPETTACELKYRGRAVKPLAGGCAWKLTKKMKKKTVELHLVLSYGGVTLDQTLPLKVS